MKRWRERGRGGRTRRGSGEGEARRHYKERAERHRGRREGMNGEEVRGTEKWGGG